MKTTIKSLHLDNFGKHSESIGGKPLDIQLGQRTIISGCNKTGKSTIKRSIQYIFGCKDENGKEITGIRPHDENGVDIDGLTTVAGMTISVDGVENTLKKTYFQKKNRQGEYTGESDTQYFIDGVRKSTKKSYEEFVQTILPDPVCMSAQEFFKQDTTGRRNLLESTFFSRTIDEIIDQNPEFEELRGKLRANSVSDLKSACNEKINGKGRGANHVEGLNDKLTKLIHQIEFELSKKVDVDVAELELQKNALNEQIAENKTKQEDISKEFEEQQKASDGVIELQCELNDLKRKANEFNNKRKLKLEDEISDIQIEIKKASNNALIFDNKIKADKNYLEQCQKAIEAEREKYRTVSATEFNENELICPTCKREYEAERQKELRDSFDKNKSEHLEKITSSGNYFKGEIEKCKSNIMENEKQKKEWEDKIFEFQKSLKPLVDELEKLPESIDISDRPEVQEIQRQIAEKEAAMNKGNGAEEIRQQLKGELESLQSQLYDVQKQLGKEEENNRIEKTVEELKEKQRSVSQEIADVERELDLLKQFDRKKAELLESDVNSWFDYVQVKMSEIQQNGEIKDCCKIMVLGEDFDRNLNHGAKILAQIDISLGFQKKYGVNLPVMVDDAESVDSDKIPNIDNQIIIFRRTDDTELKIVTE